MLQVTKSEGSSNATSGDSAESLAEDLLKRFSDSQPNIKKEPTTSEFDMTIITIAHMRITLNQ